MSVYPVSVGQTAYPLKSSPNARGPVASFAQGAAPRQTVRLLDGPPYANGAPHLGHVLNKHLKDAVARALVASGAAVAWRPGWDCHGLPLELAVERAGTPRSDRAAFLAAARSYAAQQVDVQAQVFREQGWSAQWDSPWTTMDPGQEAATLRVLARLVEAGRLRVAETAVPWCPHCQSTLSGAEQEDRPLQRATWLVPFALSLPFRGQPQVVLSWTTTPWTLPLHQGLVVAPETVLVALELPGHGWAWVSQDTAERWAAALGASVSEHRCRGGEMAGQWYSTPWTQGQVTSDSASLAPAGTGVLHAVFGLAEADTSLARRHGWPQVQHLTPDGRVQSSPCLEQNGCRAGPDANAPVGPAYATSPWWRVLPEVSAQPHCWRHKKPLLTRASRQVFLSLDTAVRARADAMVKGMAFTPESARSRLEAAMLNRPDWCVSRQRTWGVPMALFLDAATGQPHAKAAVWMRRVADALETQGVEAWWSTPPSEWLRGDAMESEVVRVDDVLDVWFDSGCVPQHLGSASVVVEGVDQHRGWFQSCVWVAAALGEVRPFDRVVSHGFVVDRQGDKLSKSTGGDKASGQDKAPAWSTLPTDVVRVWALAGSEGADKAWTGATVTQAQALVSRWRGVLRFLLANALPEMTVLTAPEQKDLPVWDVYWWQECRRVCDRVVEAVAQGRTGEAVTLAGTFGEAFSAVCLGSWKDRLYCAPGFLKERQALDVVLKGCLAAWGTVLEVLVPRLRAEATPHWPRHLPESFPLMAMAEASEVSQVLAVRQALAPLAEAWAQRKVPPVRCFVSAWKGAPAWPGQLLADALGVAHLVAPAPGASVDVPWVEVPGMGPVAMGQSEAPVCPRCRKAQPTMLEKEVCEPCAERVGGLGPC